MFLRANTAKENAWGPDHTFTLGTVNSLGLLYSDQGKMADAEAMWLRALAGYEKAGGPDQKSTLDTRYNLAELLERKYKGRDAVEHFYRMVKGLYETTWTRRSGNC